MWSRRRVPAHAGDSVAAIVDDTGHVPPLASFQDEFPDPQAGDTHEAATLLDVAKNGPSGGDRVAWKAAWEAYVRGTNLIAVSGGGFEDEPRTELDDRTVTRWRDGERTEPPR